MTNWNRRLVRALAGKAPSEAILDVLIGSDIVSLPINLSTGNNVLVAGVVGHVIAVHYLHLRASSTDATILFESDEPAGALLCGLQELGASVDVLSLTRPNDGGWSLGFVPPGWFKTEIGEALHMTVGGTGNVSGVIGYSVRPG